MRTRRIAFATYQGAPLLTPDDRLAATALASRGVEVVPAIWSARDVDWGAFDATILRSMWDYHHRVPEFRAWLGRLEQEEAACWNPASLARWNLDKRYLRDLQAAGIPTIPTAWLSASQLGDLGSVMDCHGWRDVVLKPAIGATAHRIVRISRENADAVSARSRDLVEHGDAMLQPFIAGIASHGEWSLMFFGGEFSHAVLKQAAAGDFRVQEEFGGRSTVALPPPELRAAAERILASLQQPWLYARVDGVAGALGDFLLMELEMLEPLLFLAHDPGAADRFAEAIIRRLGV